MPGPFWEVKKLGLFPQRWEGWGLAGRTWVGSLWAAGGNFPLCPTMKSCEPLALPGGLGVLINPQGPDFHPLIRLILPGGVVMLLPAGGCCACSTAPTPSLAWAGCHRCCWEL